MSWTQEQIKAMKETQLQEEVLVPLFTAMGFQDVHVHQGTTEFGKDLVMWKPGGFGERVNFAVVAKAKDITGSVSGSAGAGTVANQIHQCFGRNFSDHVTGEEQRVNHVYVVNSHDITKEAIEAIRSLISNSERDRAVTYIDGDKLWKELEKYTPEKLIPGKLREIKEILDAASPDHRLVANTEGEVRIEPKHPGAIPPILTGNLVFPDTEEGRAKREEYERHISTGNPIIIPKQFIQDLKVPDFLAPYLTDITEGDYKLVVQSPTPPISLDIKAEMNCEDGQQAILEYVHLKAVQVGRDEITFNNDEQSVPWKVTMVFNRKEGRINFSVKIEFNNLNVKQASQGLHFLEAMAKGGLFRMEQVATGLDVTQPVPSGVYQAPSKKRIELVDKLVFIQEKTRIIIPFINGPVTIDDARTILNTAEEIEQGLVAIEAQPTTITTRDINWATMIAAFPDISTPQPFHIKYPEGREVEIMGIKIPLGPVIYSWDKVYITEDDLNQLKSDIDNYEEGKTIDIRLTPAEGCLARMIYLEWLSPELRQKLELTEEVDESTNTEGVSPPGDQTEG
jgi:hypothetical protein